MILNFENTPLQKFDTVINEINYTFQAKYNASHSFWVLDIISNDFAVYGVKIVSGINICEPYPFIPFSLISNDLEDPILSNLKSFRLEVI